MRRKEQCSELKEQEKIKFFRSVEVGPSFGYFSTTAEEDIAYLTALQEVHFVPQNKLRVTEKEARQQLPLHTGAGSASSNASLLPVTLGIYSRVKT